MLNGKDGQAEFVPLTSRPGAGSGQVAVLNLVRPAGFSARPKVDETAALEARGIAQWLKEQGLAGLRASCWSQVAMLCPRKRWFAPLERALRAEGFETQIHSPKDLRGDQPAYAWFAALMAIAAEPHNAFEIVGVLREIFGLSDQDLADFAEGDGSRFQTETETKAGGPVAAALDLLAQARAQALRLPLREAARCLVEAASLRGRLRCIVSDPADADDELDALLVRAAEAEVANPSFTDWTDELRREFKAEVEAKHVQSNAVQLITCQKAKGLQWDAVVLPQLSRNIKYTTEYPLVVSSGPGQPARVAFNEADLEEYKHTLKRRKQHELERILYVSLTRARRTLVLVDDRAITRPGKISFTELLQVAGDNRATWEALPLEVAPEAVAPAKAAPPVEAEALPVLSAAARAEAVRRAGTFVRRTLPHALARHILPEEPESALSVAAEAVEAMERAKDYGTWWHGVMERLDWPAGPKAWEPVFRAALPDCPMPGRAEREWKLFVASDLAKRLTNPKLVIQPEMPFLWKKADAECLEGFMDLAVFDPSENEWLVIDWKTNIETKDLRNIYAGQINAYLEALKGLTGLDASGGLYATATGEWIVCP
ncbi:MAG: PD-(D/E)XK nuclease family protein, partial [Kiritimatiellae bacterium]|nr:PD-(D/E)XK nuclease family protein [Kiritimatiellia bacterium]